MTARTFEIQFQDDHLERIAQTRKPILALAELIWNAVDADAKHIDVTLVEDDLDGLKAIRVADNGHGIPFPDIECVGPALVRSGGRKRAFLVGDDCTSSRQVRPAEKSNYGA